MFHRKEYVNKDPRIQCFRNGKNIGATRNFNLAFELSTGKYFKWNVHDDVCMPEFLHRSVEVLNSDQSVVLCNSQTRIIDEHGKYIWDHDHFLDFSSQKPIKRFRKYLFHNIGHNNEIFGLTRACELKKTSLIESYISSEKVLLGELILRGRIYLISDSLLYRRRHDKQVWRNHPSIRSLSIAIDPKKQR